MAASLAGVLILAAAPCRAADAGGSGWWVDDSDRAGLVIAPCAEGLCGTVEWLKQPIDPATGGPRLDKHNPVPALRTRPLCGLRILWGFQPSGPNRWTGGKAYDPESGNTYSATATLRPDGTLNMHGYVLIPLFGRTKTFSRPRQPLERCSGE